MVEKLSRFWLTILFVLAAAPFAFGQTNDCTPTPAPSIFSAPMGRPTPQREELPKSIKENLVKHCIERQKKEYEELLKRSEEAVRLSEELEESYAASKRLSPADQKKLDRLEKLVKKIRSDLGGGDDEKDLDEENPASMVSALDELRSSASKLFEEIQRSTRYSISVVAIQSSNMLLKVLKFIRVRQ